MQQVCGQFCGQRGGRGQKIPKSSGHHVSPHTWRNTGAPLLISFSAGLVIIRVIRVNKEEIISAEWRVAILQLAHLSERLNNNQLASPPQMMWTLMGEGDWGRQGRSPRINVCTDKDIIARNSAFSFFSRNLELGRGRQSFVDGNLSSAARGSQSFISHRWPIIKPRVVE